ncbi:pyruvate dehydrogenase (acetyl-transferring), homodimeric type [uncultured Pseudoteredinibacter sp.]|uniref:pyruvate dehydrogenase (acetyl-transferring), homodimeric type n=1 Tax=uncultured Pseudoteredinibacter sp. TaxID=1641701 RepID=UPI00261EC129|nr:pyruvate dehydrogenase (acetyl-transferring), homodimeric type [uncultured Pseudoteredinibacter sp.]
MSDSQQFLDDVQSNAQEWEDSLRYIIEEFGVEGVQGVLAKVWPTLDASNVSSQYALNTPYQNTIPPQRDLPYPGDIALEKRIENILKWNAMAMVVKGADSGKAAGGHIASYASAATMMEVGFHHIFRSRTSEYGGDMVLLQGTTAPGTYARAHLEGRFDDERLLAYRRELLPGGLCSYSHPRSIPDFWEVPNGSMGLGVPTAIYQARFVKYLEARGLKPKNGGKVWCFIGDGESDEPEVLGMINTPVRERLDNLVFVVNCNLQRLDGPVRGNGKVIQEFERSYRGAGWNIIKVIWGAEWDRFLKVDYSGALQRRMASCLDGEYQRLSTLDVAERKAEWIAGDPNLQDMFKGVSDEEFDLLIRGGHDHKKMYSAYKAASEYQGGPTVIIVKTIKGDGMGYIAQGSNTAHQKKVLNEDDRQFLARAYSIPLDAEAVARADFYRPSSDSPEVKYVQMRREALGGFMPNRSVNCEKLDVQSIDAFNQFAAGTNGRAMSTTTAMVRTIAKLMKDKSVGELIVPIVPDEARTFGMEGLFKSAGIYSVDGQKYTPVDAKSLTPYREVENGQLLQEGICEVGAMGSFLAAGTAYAVHGIPTIPFYIFYSIFGPQRIADMMWHCADMLCRGFLLGGTAGRTTLNGEGIQHQDGHSPVMASAFPNLRSYDPAFAYEVEVIVKHGIKEMYEDEKNVFYYLTLYNENYEMPERPDGDGIDDGIVKGMYQYYRTSKQSSDVNLLSSGSIMQQALNARDKLETLGYTVTIWSVTSFIELYREGQAAERFNRLHPTSEKKICHLEALMEGESGVCVSVTDYMESLAESISRWMPKHYAVLGTDGFGLSESRESLRDFFEVSSDYVVHAALSLMHRSGAISSEVLLEQSGDLNVDADKIDPMVR